MRSRDVVSRKCLIEGGAGRGRVGKRAGKVNAGVFDFLRVQVRGGGGVLHILLCMAVVV